MYGSAIDPIVAVYGEKARVSIKNPVHEESEKN
jgi:hypothetical protein